MLIVNLDITILISTGEPNDLLSLSLNGFDEIEFTQTDNILEDVNIKCKDNDFHTFEYRFEHERKFEHQIRNSKINNRNQLKPIK